MTAGPEEVADILKQWGSGLSSSLHGEPSEEAQKRRIALLQDVYTTCSEAIHSGQGDAGAIAQTLGDGSRDGIPTRILVCCTWD